MYILFTFCEIKKSLKQAACYKHVLHLFVTVFIQHRKTDVNSNYHISNFIHPAKDRSFTKVITMLINHSQNSNYNTLSRIYL